VAIHKQFGVPMLKVYSRLNPDAFAELAKQAKASGLRLVGHVPARVGLESALAQGMASIEHLTGYAELASADAVDKDAWFANPMVIESLYRPFVRLDPAKLRRAVELTRAAGAWNVPTLVVVDHVARLDDRAFVAAMPGAEAVAPWIRASWDPTS